MDINFGGVVEKIVTRKEFPLKKAQKVLKGKTIAVLGYGIWGRRRRSTCATTAST